MKKTLVLFLCLVILSCFCLSFSFGKGWKNSLKPKEKAISIDLTDKVQSNYDIVIPLNPNEYEIKAGEELVQYLKQIYLVNFKVVKENEKYGPHFISLGETKLLERSGLKEGITFNQDGYAIKEKDGNIYIFGGVWTGPLNGVYALLEEDLGCRFWTKLHDDTIPTIKNEKLIFAPRVFNPRFITRNAGTCEFADALYYNRNRFRGYDAYGFAHTAFKIVPKSEFEKHPELFALRNGKRHPDQLCWSNPTNINTITEYVKNLAIKGKQRINVSPMDGGGLCCECDLCKAIDKPEGTKAASYIICLNTVCERLEKDYPDVRIFGLAYLDYVTPPKTIKPHKNLTIQICSDSSDWPWPFCTYDETDKFRTDVYNWVKLGTDTLTWNYVCNYDHYL